MNSVLALATFVVVCVYTSQSSAAVVHQLPCIPLRNCDSLYRLWNNRNVIAGTNKTSIIRFIKSKMCKSVEKHQIKVFCPDGIIVPKEEVIVDPNMEGQSVLGTADGKKNKNSCKGTLKIYTRDKDTLEELSTLTIKDSITSLSDVLEKRLLENAIVDGSCCWRLHSLREFKGKRLNLPLGHRDVPAIVPSSASVLVCAGNATDGKMAGDKPGMDKLRKN